MIAAKGVKRDHGSDRAQQGDVCEEHTRHRALAKIDQAQIAADSPPVWNFPDDLPREQWIAQCRRLVSAEKNVQWALGTWWIFGEHKYGNGRALAEEIGIDYKTALNYAAVARKFELSRRRENLSFGHHEAVAALPAPQQDQWLERAERDGLSVNGLRREVKVAVMRDRRVQRELELAEGTEAASKALGKKLYGVIYADPPWRFHTYGPAGQLMSSPDNHYPTMALDDIKALKVPAAENCVLFLWATIPMLREAHAVMAAWGFEYKSAIVWVKDKAGIGYWVRGQAELLLIGTRGDVPAPGPGNQPDAVIEAPRGRHSEKPEIFAEEIERLYPNVPKLEMFARTVRFGWDAWGNEVSATEVES